MTAVTAPPPEHWIAVDTPLHPFLFVGCWNQTGRARDAVMAAVHQRPEQTVVLGGDNIYPTKSMSADGRKRKVYDPAVLATGAAFLSSKEVYAALGNHNIADPAIYDRMIQLPWHIRNPYYGVEFADGYCLVFLDTNRMEEPAAMLDWFAKAQRYIADARQQYYLVQHEPIVSFKKGAPATLYDGVALLDAITVLPRAVLCADTHNYQRGTIQYNPSFLNRVMGNGPSLTQYVVGTGGAAPDPIGAELDDSVTVLDTITYTLEDADAAYGFLAVPADSAPYFVSVAGWNLTGGDRRRRNGKTRKLVKRI